MTPKQALFVQEYMVDANATQAAIRAGYSARTAQRIGSENLSKPVIAEAIAKARNERSERTKITADDVVEELARIGFANMGDFVQPDGRPKLEALSSCQWAAVSEITSETYMEGKGEDARPVKRVRIKLHDKLAALDKLARHLGMYNGKLTVRGDAENPITVLIREIQGSALQPVVDDPDFIDALPEPQDD